MSRRRGQGRNTIFKRLLDGTLTDAELLASSNLKDTHHLKSRGQGGSNKKSNKNELSAIDHRIWHFFVKDSSLDEFADKISNFVSRDYRFFAVDIKNPIASIVKINNWIEKSTNDYIVRIKIKEKSKIIKFRPLNHVFATENRSS